MISNFCVSCRGRCPARKWINVLMGLSKILCGALTWVVEQIHRLHPMFLNAAWVASYNVATDTFPISSWLYEVFDETYFFLVIMGRGLLVTWDFNGYFETCIILLNVDQWRGKILTLSHSIVHLDLVDQSHLRCWLDHLVVDGTCCHVSRSYFNGALLIELRFEVKMGVACRSSPLSLSFRLDSSRVDQLLQWFFAS